MRRCSRSFITSLIEAPAEVKQAMKLARHSRPDITMNAYARKRKDNLTVLVNKMADSLQRKSKRVKCVSNEEERGDDDDVISPFNNQ